ncbi:unnamed protein product, partial [Staurois parvus]
MRAPSRLARLRAPSRLANCGHRVVWQTAGIESSKCWNFGSPSATSGKTSGHPQSSGGTRAGTESSASDCLARQRASGHQASGHLACQRAPRHLARQWAPGHQYDSRALSQLARQRAPVIRYRIIWINSGHRVNWPIGTVEL